jgi:hypothetical protein
MLNKPSQNPTVDRGALRFYYYTNTGKKTMHKKFSQKLKKKYKMITAESGLANVRVANPYIDMNKPIFQGEWRIPERFYTYDSKHEWRKKTLREPPKGRIINIEQEDMDLMNSKGLTVTLSDETFKKSVVIQKVDPLTGKVTEHAVYPFLQTTSIQDRLAAMRRLGEEHPGSIEVQRELAVIAMGVLDKALHSDLPQEEKDLIIQELRRYQLVTTSDAMHSLGRRLFHVPNELRGDSDTILAVLLFMLQNNIKVLRVYNRSSEISLFTLPKVGTSASKTHPIVDTQTGVLYTKEQANELISQDTTINNGIHFNGYDEDDDDIQQANVQQLIEQFEQ